jgi:hypothetical protein
VVLFDRSCIKLYSRKFSNKLVQAPSCERHKTAPRILFLCKLYFFPNNAIVSGCDTFFTSYTSLKQRYCILPNIWVRVSAQAAMKGGGEGEWGCTLSLVTCLSWKKGCRRVAAANPRGSSFETKFCSWSTLSLLRCSAEGTQTSSA